MKSIDSSKKLRRGEWITEKIETSSEKELEMGEGIFDENED